MNSRIVHPNFEPEGSGGAARRVGKGTSKDCQIPPCGVYDSSPKFSFFFCFLWKLRWLVGLVGQLVAGMSLWSLFSFVFVETPWGLV